MKKFISALNKLLDNPSTEKALIIALPCLAVIIAAAILVPTLNDFLSGSDIPVPAETVCAAAESPGLLRSPASTPGPRPVPTTRPTPTPEPVPDKPVQLSASSLERDMYIKIKDENGEPIQGQRFRLDIGYPGGEKCSFDSEEDGSCYLVRLDAGEYTVSMQPCKGYAQPQSISCTVKDEVEHVQIEDIEEIVEVKDVTEISSSETKTVSSSIEEAEVIFTPAENQPPQVQETPEPVQTPEVTQIPKLDSSGAQLYTYRCVTGPNGFLLDKNTEQETDVLPIDETGDGVPEYGMRLVHDEAGEEPDYYVSIILYNSDNTPVEPYSIYAEPVMDTVENSDEQIFVPAPAMVGWQEIDGKQYYFDSKGARVTGVKNIDGKLYYFNDYGEKAGSLGVDVSFYNKDIDWNAVKEQGIDFAIIRVGGRTWRTDELYDDICFADNLYEAKQAGLRVGVYFYSTAVTPVEAVQEASVVLDRLGGAGLDMPVFYDTEFSGIYPNGRADSLSTAERTEIIRAFCDTISSGGYSPGVYSGQNFFNSQLDYSALSSYTIWLASYTSNNRLPAFNNRYDIWQFTDSGKVNGIPTAVDLNVIF